MVTCDWCKKELETIFHGDEIEILGYPYFVCVNCFSSIKKAKERLSKKVDLYRKYLNDALDDKAPRYKDLMIAEAVISLYVWSEKEAPNNE